VSLHQASHDTPTHGEIVASLRQHPGMTDAPAEPLAVLASFFEVVEVVGRSFLVEGEESDALFMVIEGQAEVVRAGPEGQPVVVGYLEAPDLAGFAGVLTPQQAIASVRARGRVQLLRMSGVATRELLLRDDDVSAVLRRALLVELATRMSEATRLLARLSNLARQERAAVPLVV